MEEVRSRLSIVSVHINRRLLNVGEFPRATTTTTTTTTNWPMPVWRRATLSDVFSSCREIRLRRLGRRLSFSVRPVKFAGPARETANWADVSEISIAQAVASIVVAGRCRPPASYGSYHPSPHENCFLIRRSVVIARSCWSHTSNTDLSRPLSDTIERRTAKTLDSTAAIAVAISDRASCRHDQFLDQYLCRHVLIQATIDST